MLGGDGGRRCPGKPLFRSPTNPPAAFGGSPCDGDRQELQACYTDCGTGTIKQGDSSSSQVLTWPVPWMAS